MQALYNVSYTIPSVQYNKTCQTPEGPENMTQKNGPKMTQRLDLADKD